MRTNISISISITLPYLSEIPGWHSAAKRSRARHGLRCCMIPWSLAADEMRSERCGPASPLLQTSIMFKSAASRVDSSQGNQNLNKWLEKKEAQLISRSERAGRWGWGGGGGGGRTGWEPATLRIDSRQHKCGNNGETRRGRRTEAAAASPRKHTGRRAKALRFRLHTHSQTPDIHYSYTCMQNVRMQLSAGVQRYHVKAPSSNVFL